MTTLNTNQFIWDKKEKVFSQEASSLGEFNDIRNFSLKSDVTGKSVVMTLTGIESAGGNAKEAPETIVWYYTPEAGNDFSAVIFND